MRTATLVLTGILSLGVVETASAQNFQSAITGVKPSEVQFKAVDTGSAVAGTNLSSMGQSSFNLTSFFRRINPFSSTTIGRSVIPAPRYANAYQPLKPINSTVNR